MLVFLAVALAGCDLSDPFELELSVGSESADISVFVDGEPVAADSSPVLTKTFSSFEDAVTSSVVHLHAEQNAQLIFDENFLPGAACVRAGGGTSWIRERVFIAIDAPRTSECHDCTDVAGWRVMTCR